MLIFVGLKIDKYAVGYISKQKNNINSCTSYSISSTG